MLILAIDFDGALAERAPDGHLIWRAGALTALLALRTAQCRLVLHSCRSTPEVPTHDPARDRDRFYATGELPLDVTDQWDRFDEMRAFLKSAGVWGWLEVWQASGKPFADRYIDDRMELPEWGRLAREFGVSSTSWPTAAGHRGSSLAPTA